MQATHETQATRWQFLFSVSSLCPLSSGQNQASAPVLSLGCPDGEAPGAKSSRSPRKADRGTADGNLEESKAFRVHRPSGHCHSLSIPADYASVVVGSWDQRSVPTSTSDDGKGAECELRSTSWPDDRGATPAPGQPGPLPARAAADLSTSSAVLTSWTGLSSP